MALLPEYWLGISMTGNDDPIVYKGMTAPQLADAYNVFLTVPDPFGWLQSCPAKVQLCQRGHTHYDITLGNSVKTSIR